MHLNFYAIVRKMLREPILGHLVHIVTPFAAFEAFRGGAIGVQMLNKLLVVEGLLFLVWHALMSELKVAEEVSYESTWLRHLKVFLSAFLISTDFDSCFFSFIRMRINNILIAFVTVKMVAFSALFNICCERYFLANCAVEPLGHCLRALFSILEVEV